MVRSSRFVLVLSAFILFCSPAASFAKTANFAGTWNFSLKGVQDTCGLGMKGKTQNINGVVITQKGKKASLTIQGVKFSGRVTGNKLKGAGKYSTSGIVISGTIQGTLKSKKKMSIPNTKLNIRAGSTRCFLVMRGTGAKAG